MWPIKEKENRHLLIQWPYLNFYSKLQECVVTVLLLTSTTLSYSKCVQGLERRKNRPRQFLVSDCLLLYFFSFYFFFRLCNEAVDGRLRPERLQQRFSLFLLRSSEAHSSDFHVHKKRKKHMGLYFQFSLHGQFHITNDQFTKKALQLFTNC